MFDLVRLNKSLPVTRYTRASIIKKYFNEFTFAKGIAMINKINVRSILDN